MCACVCVCVCVICISVCVCVCPSVSLGGGQDLNALKCTCVDFTEVADWPSSFLPLFCVCFISMYRPV